MQIFRLLVTHSASASNYSLFLKTKNSLQQRLLKHPQAKFCPLVSAPLKRYATLVLELSSMLQLPRFRHTLQTPSSVRGGADKSLARPNFRCRRTESIVSLEDCKSFLVTEAERKYVRRRGRFRQHRDASCHQGFFPPARQGAEGNSYHSDRNIRGTCTIVCHRQKLGGPV